MSEAPKKLMIGRVAQSAQAAAFPDRGDAGVRALVCRVPAERALGIGDWSTTQAPDGKVEVHAKLGFESASNQDVAAIFNDASAVVRP